MTLEQIQKLSDEELNRKVAELCGKSNQWVLKKRGVYYRPNAAGYCNDIRDAWVVSEEEADKHVYPHDEPVTKHPAPVPQYCSDLNACAEMEKGIEDRRYWAWVLCEMVYPWPEPSTLTLGDYSKGWWAGGEEIGHLLSAKARHRAEAFLFTKLNS